MTFRTIELRDANGDLVCEEPIRQPIGDLVQTFATFGNRLFRHTENLGGQVCVYYEINALRCGRAVITDGQIEGVEVSDIVEAVGGSNAT